MIGSIRNVTFRANDPLNNYLTKNNRSWSPSQMGRILQNPLYCIADQDAYEYFKNHTKVQIVNSKNDFNGTHGLMFYNRRKPHNKTTRERSEDEWILVIGDHEGFIPGKVFAKVQHKLSLNHSNPPRLGRSAISPLTGLVRCGRCNSSMSVFTSTKTSDERFRYFRCLTKEQRSKVLCDNTNIRADLLEEMIVKHISGLCSNKEFITGLLESSNDDLDSKRIPHIAKRSKYQADLDSVDKEMKNLVVALGKGTLPETIIQSRFKELENQKKALKNNFWKLLRNWI